MGGRARLRHQRPERPEPDGVGHASLRVAHPDGRRDLRGQPDRVQQQLEQLGLRRRHSGQRRPRRGLHGHHRRAAGQPRREPLAGPTTDIRTGCHDAAVIRGTVNLAACASADTVNVWDIGDNSTPGGSIEDPELLYTIVEPGIGTAGSGGRWHSAAFTWDGKVLVLGWEPGGGGLPECEQTDPAVKKSMFFYDAATGSKLGQWTLPRVQSSEENCTIHNFNIVPLRSGRYVAISGNYQAGTWVTDFTDPANPVTVAWSDPPPLGQVVDPTTGQLVNELGGAWSSYWYNNFVYESEITKGVNVFRVSDPRLAGVIRLNHLNPQTEEFSLD